ncbi:Uncharacterised protein [Streptococcus suis]|uniref:Uncharacterized protein n=4 Tax=Streptococcus TaxID=1301 RepID=A0A345VMA8_9STRE|nr:hypothetical protein Sp14A_19740 [Streptococcus pluranimalium]CYX64602.1 Uncharacterised protein [Streptococcus suis]VDC43075.1 hypothetical protein FMV2238Y02_15570 [Streptococcus canis]VTS82431.1 Uncharacterised protein [Streptococcus dysgalactiae]CYZ63212.1 Uncharacterised protein [Streptococcus suis]
MNQLEFQRNHLQTDYYSESYQILNVTSTATLT